MHARLIGEQRYVNTTWQADSRGVFFRFGRYVDAASPACVIYNDLGTHSQEIVVARTRSTRCLLVLVGSCASILGATVQKNYLAC